MTEACLVSYFDPIADPEGFTCRGLRACSMRGGCEHALRPTRQMDADHPEGRLVRRSAGQPQSRRPVRGQPPCAHLPSSPWSIRPPPFRRIWSAVRPGPHHRGMVVGHPLFELRREADMYLCAIRDVQGVILHSDRGSHTAHDLAVAAGAHGLRRSMGGPTSAGTTLAPNRCGRRSSMSTTTGMHLELKSELIAAVDN